MTITTKDNMSVQQILNPTRYSPLCIMGENFDVNPPFRKTEQALCERLVVHMGDRHLQDRPSRQRHELSADDVAPQPGEKIYSGVPCRMHPVVVWQQAFPWTVQTAVKEAEMVTQGKNEPAVGDLHQMVVPSVLVADFRHDRRIFRCVAGRVEGTDKDMGFRMTEIIQLQVQARPFSAEQAFRPDVFQYPAVAGKTGLILQHVEHGEIGPGSAGFRFNCQADRDSPFLGLHKRISQSFVAEIIRCPKYLATGRHGRDAGIKQFTQCTGLTIRSAEKDAELSIAC